MLDRKQKLTRLIQFGVEISRVADLDLLLEKVLGEARTILNAEAGSIYIKDGDNLNFSYAQNEVLQKKLGPNKKLIYTTFSMPIDNNSIAGYVALNEKTLNIPDAYSLSPSLPFSFDEHFDELSGYHTQSMLTIPLTNTRSEIVGVLQLINARDDMGKVVPFLDEDEPIVQHFALYAANAIERAQMTRTTIMRMIGMAELRDPKETGPHVNRVAAYSVEIFEAYARKKNLPADQIETQRDSLRLAAMLHDVGKVAISDTILKKPGRFTEEEFEIMKQHTVLGAKLFDDARSDFDEFSALVALNHHERWDGTGYPGALNNEPGLSTSEQTPKPSPKKGEEIPLFGRIVALADVYDALCSRRVYKKAWAEEDVLQTIREESGRHFDPEIVDVFFEIIDMIHAISRRYPDAQEN